MLWWPAAADPYLTKIISICYSARILLAALYIPIQYNSNLFHLTPHQRQSCSLHSSLIKRTLITNATNPHPNHIPTMAPSHTPSQTQNEKAATFLGAQKALKAFLKRDIPTQNEPTEAYIAGLESRVEAVQAAYRNTESYQLWIQRRKPISGASSS